MRSPSARAQHGSAPTAATMPILANKLYTPRARPGQVARPRLLARLNDGLTDKLTVIAALAGFGKTTLLAEWLEEKAKGKRQKVKDTDDSETVLPFSFSLLPFRVAWVSLDANDNDPTRFWSYLSLALDTFAPGIYASIAVLLQSPQPPPIEAILTTLLNALSSQRLPSNTISPDVLILDDYHVIEAQPIHQALTMLIDYLPPHLHLVIATRSDPPLPLARLRARGSLTELRTSD